LEVPVSEPGNPGDAVNALSDRFWDGMLELSPMTATVLGYERDLDKLDDPGPEGRARARALFEGILAEANAIEARPDAVSIPLEERITLDIMRVICDIEIEQQDQHVYRLKVVDHMEGAQTLLPLLAAFQPVETPEKYDMLLARLAGYPKFMAENVQMVRDGLECGLTAASIVTERTIAQLERMLALPDDASPILDAVKVPEGADREKLVDAVRRYVKPADAAFLDALKGDYRKASRQEPGICSAPNGEALYRTQIRFWTSLDIDPAELHRVGLEELESLEAERRVIARDMGFGDDTHAARGSFRADPKYIPQSVEALIERVNGQIERAMAAAPKYFGTMPKAGCEVRPVESFKEADAPAAYYYPPSIDGSRPGIYFVNTYDLPSRSYVGLASMSFHEAVPGHHFQIALQAEHPSLNTFRRLGSRSAGMAYVEGWGLYSERLADEMGLFLDQVERFGMLDAQAHRAARLVVDTGIHAFGWNREKGVATLLDAGLSNTDASIETDRFICWPGQALAYKTGQREISRLRAEATEKLGPKFDLRQFHDAVLAHGSLPLATLSRELPGWLGYSR
jgi:uncharacterized protein (DUF885 family)